MSGRDSAAPSPTPPATRKPMTGTAHWRRPATPRKPAMRTAARTMSTLRASLSAVPKSPTMNSLAPGGWLAMTRSPMAMTSEGAPATRPAISSAMAMPSAAARAPATKAATSTDRGRRAGRVTGRASAGSSGGGAGGVPMTRISKQTSVTMPRQNVRHTAHP